MLLASKYKFEIDKLKNLLNKEFEMKNFGNAKRILGMEIFRNTTASTLFLSQERYLRKVLERFDMLDCKPCLTPLGAHFKLSITPSSNIKDQVDEFPYVQAVGSLMYAMVFTRHDIAHAVSVVSRSLSCPNKTHWSVV